MTTESSPKEGPQSRKNLYQCGTCSQSYSRVDHLSRHVRSHTQEKPYQCHVCGKQFGRIDLLNRHTSLHNPENEKSSRKRRRDGDNGAMVFRTAQACASCAENHLRCDDKKPCARCQRRNIACTIPRRVSEGSEGPEGPGLYQNVKHSFDQTINHEVAPSQFHIEPEGPNWLSGPPEQSQQTSDRLPLESTELQAPNHLSDPSNLLAPEPNDLFLGSLNSLCSSGIRTPRNLIPFGLETDLDLSIVDLSFLESYNSKNPFEFEEYALAPLPVPNETAPEISLEKEPQITNDPSSLQKITWRFVPAPQDHGYAEHDNLLLPDQAGSIPTPQSLVEFERRTTADKLDLASRDKILSIFLSQLKQPTLSHPVSFPSVDLLDSLIQYYLTAPFSSASSWFHTPTFIPKKARPELLLALAAAGAVLTPDLSLRKLGYAMQEVIRLQLTTVFETNNTNIRNLEIHQAFCLYLEIGLWSGNSRKIEITESFQKPLITMVRRGGLFLQSSYPFVPAPIGQSGRVLENQWESWARQESVKRLVYHLFQHDAQTSMALLSSPLISYAEVCVPLPAPSALWTARSAVEWRDLYCKELASSNPSSLPTLIECVANIDLLDSSRQFIDFKLSCEAVSQALWGIVLQYQQFSVLLKNQPRYWDNGLVLTSRYQELTRILDYYRIAYEHESAFSLHFTLLSMHVPIENVQFLAMLESQADHPVRASLRDWADQKESRVALWHAGQIFKHARLLPYRDLRDFAVVELYHAGLTIWAYGMCKQWTDHGNQGVHPQSQRHSSPTNRLPSSREMVESESAAKVWLDGTKGDDVNRYIAFERAIPVLQSIQTDSVPVYVHSPRAVLDLVVALMDENYRQKPLQRPPLVMNLIHVIEKLRDGM